MAIEKIFPEENSSFEFPYMGAFILVLLLQMLFDNYLNMRQIKVLQVILILCLA